MAEEKPEVVVVRQKASHAAPGAAGLSPQARVFWEHFDEKFYLAQFPAEDAAKIRNAAQHYLQVGWKAGLDPSPRFCTSAYLARYSDVRDAGVNPLEHYAKFGVHEGRIIAGAGQASRDDAGATEKASIRGAHQSAPRTVGQVSSRIGASHKRLASLSNFSSDLTKLDRSTMVQVLTLTGLVQVDDYLRYNQDLRGAEIDPIVHYVTWGHLEGRRVHLLFDQQFYLTTVSETVPDGVPPVIHYVLRGAKMGGQPHPMFDAVKYARDNGLDLDETNPLIHFTATGGAHAEGSLRMFDQAFYLKNYPFAAHYHGGAIAHFLDSGVFEGRRPCESFNTDYYYAAHLGNDRTINAVNHYLMHGMKAGLSINQPEELPTVTREIRRFANPGPMFESVDRGIVAGGAKNARIFAFYLPQFHAFPENDAWWGKGFSEWRNLARGAPRFAGHYQPRIPRDLSFYDLSTPEPMRKQVELALEMGLSGFAFYFYWFNRHRLLETPLNNFLANKTLDMPFMLIWANENWTRRWDGMESEVLIRQDHDPADDAALVDCFNMHFADPRYVRIGGRPLLIIYRADIIPDCARTLARWRALFAERHREDPLIFMAQTFACNDPRGFGFDGAIEFPPHKIGNSTQPINKTLTLLDYDFTGDVRSYDDAVKVSLAEAAPPFPLIKTVFPSWDNNARRQTSGMVFHGSTPEKFGSWLSGAIDFAQRNPVNGESIVFVNAWNEWCEGAYLEPDVHFGGAYLNALAHTVTGTPAALRAPKYKVLLIGHDAFPAGAQMILLNAAKVLKSRFGVDVSIILLAGGALVDEYKRAAPTSVVPLQSLATAVADFKREGYAHVITNTVVAGGAGELLKANGFSVTSLVHELPNLIRSYGLESNVEVIRQHSDAVVFPTAFVRDAFEKTFGAIGGRVVERSQGLYRQTERDRSAATAVRKRLGLKSNDCIVINVAYGDLRKGVDIFSQMARNMRTGHPDLHFVWIGDLHPDMKRWLPSGSHNNMHFVGHMEDVGLWLNAADVFFLTSREDPFPSVVLEALQVGLPVVAFNGNGGFTDLLRDDPRLGQLVDEDDPAAAAAALLQQSKTAHKEENVRYRIKLVRDRFDNADYAFSLLQLFWPELKKVTAVVPNYNYARYMPSRLRSILDQSYPLYELIVLDDKSTDDSLAVIRSTLAATGREARVVENAENSGSVFRQWAKAIDLARGELLWIAEADDLAAPGMLEALARAHAETKDLAFAFSDSRSVDEKGEPVYASYKPYCEDVAPGALAESRVFAARDFAGEALGTANLVLNVSAVLWNRDRARSALAAAGKDLASVRLVGDWLIYLAACAEGGKVAYLDQPLNIHRRHSGSVTGAMAIKKHMDEIEKAQKKAATLAGRKRSLIARQKAYREKTEAWLKARR